MMPLYLGALAGICFYAAWHHLQIAVHLRTPSVHLLLVLAGAAFGVEALLYTLSYAPDPSIELTELQRRAEVALALLGIGGLYWFVGLRAGASRVVLVGITVALAIALFINQLTDAGLMIERVTGFEPVTTAWGDVYQQPLGPTSPLRDRVLVPVAFVPLVFLGYAIARHGWRGRPGEAAILAVVLFVPALPAFVDLALEAELLQPLHTTETALTLSLVFMSLLESYDVAQAAALEENVDQSEGLFRSLVETAADGIGVYDWDRGHFVAVNREAVRLTGLPESDLTELEADALLRLLAPSVDRSRLEETVGPVFEEEAATAASGWIELEITRPDGSRVPVELQISRLEDARESLVRITLRDLTETRRAEREQAALEAALRQAEKLETLGTLAGGIAHDFNNMLTPIVGFGELAIETLGQHPAREHVVAMTTAADRAQQLTNRILTFSRRAETRRVPFAVQPVVEQALGFLRAALPSRVRLAIELEAPEAFVVGDEVQLHQLIMSLGTNAAQAMQDEGDLRVTLHRNAERSVTLAVADTGPGIDPSIQDRIFDPFFTTKETGRGSGLGLSVVHGIVSEWGGAIELETAPGEGAEFRISLPLEGAPRPLTAGEAE